MNEYIVVVERSDDAPMVVGFDHPALADGWVEFVNKYGETAWPGSYHMYARDPVKPISAATGIVAILEEETE